MTLRVYQSFVVGLAALAAAWAFTAHGIDSWQQVLFLGFLAIVAESLAVELALVGSVSLSYAIIFAAIVFGGPAAGALVAAIGSVSFKDIAEGKPVDRLVFNTGQYVLYAVSAGMVQVALGLQPLDGAATGSAVSGLWLAGSLLLALVMAIVNMGLVGIAISLYTGMTPFAVWRDAFRSYMLNFVALALLGLVLAQLLAISGIPGTLLIVVPFAVARQTFQVYGQQSEAYRETVRSLVTALEVKDPYTRGHSERVAWYARVVAEHSGLAESEVQRIEWAALLHDIGKVAIPTSTLVKPGPLTSEEHGAIRNHPSLAASILAEIDLLADIVPYVEMHHERVDGRGYPAGIKGDSLPLGARILAVADCFDAMTSSRAYRRALSYSDACSELRAAAGSQLDSGLVGILLEAVDESATARMYDVGRFRDA